MKVSDVFVPGGFPLVTYVPREELQLEAHVRDYLDETHKVLSLSGPTKSGKTVLIKRVAENAIWISGGEIASAGEMWKVLVDKLDGWIEIEKSRSKTEGDTETGSLGVEGGAPFLKAKGEYGVESAFLDERVHTVKRNRPAPQVATDLLLLTKPVIVLDDFHYLPEAEQLRIVRGLRPLIFEGVPVILLSVPHRVYDAVRAEPEMTGRVVPLGIPFWSDSDLRAIAQQGFDALNVTADKHVVDRLIKESFGSPFLMQEFCRELCKSNDVRETVAETKKLDAPEWDAFFRSRADASSKLAFEKLARGPRERTKRIPRLLKDGRSVDIYNLVLEAIAHTGPKTTLTDVELRTSIREIMDGDPPESGQVTRILDVMTDIAKKGKGEPVVDYMSDERQLHIADPFFAYYLRWGLEQQAPVS